MLKACLAIVMLLLAATGYFLLRGSSDAAPLPSVAVPEPEKSPLPAGSDTVHEFCGRCHAYPSADSFPKALWPFEVRRAYDFFRDSKYRADAPDFESVVEYYVSRAPKELPPAQKCPAASDSFPVQFSKLNWAPPGGPSVATVTNVHLAPLFSNALDLIVCHHQPGGVWAVKPYEEPPSWHLLADVLVPCHVEVVDLDGDGIKDLLVADLGSLYPTNDSTGRVIWLRGDKTGRFTPITLLDGVGRVTDVRAADFNGDGKLDLVVAVFGWQKGEILYLENNTTDWAQPSFVRRTLDDRSGTIHVEIGDINRDGHPDIVAVLSQEHETVVSFLGDGKGGFTRKTIYDAPHPAYGSSGIQLVDMDGDGDLDVLYTNGDSLDPPALLKPYHGIQWLENRGNFPFVHHPITAQYGAMRAVAADLTGDGKRDIVSVAFIPPRIHTEAQVVGAEAVQIIRQVAPGKFERHVLASADWSHFTCTAGDLFGDGRAHIVVGNYFMAPERGHSGLLTVWKNLGPGPAKKSP